MDLGDLAVSVGVVGITIYLCLMVIKHTNYAGRTREAITKYEKAIASLQDQHTRLKATWEEKQPEVDALLDRVLELRALRDQLHIGFEELKGQAKERTRDIRVKSFRS